jgi:hypothetical protein
MFGCAAAFEKLHGAECGEYVSHNSGFYLPILPAARNWSSSGIRRR